MRGEQSSSRMPLLIPEPRLQGRRVRAVHGLYSWPRQQNSMDVPIKTNLMQKSQVLRYQARRSRQSRGNSRSSEFLIASVGIRNGFSLRLVRDEELSRRKIQPVRMAAPTHTSRKTTAYIKRRLSQYCSIAAWNLEMCSCWFLFRHTSTNKTSPTNISTTVATTMGAKLGLYCSIQDQISSLLVGSVSCPKLEKPAFRATVRKRQYRPVVRRRTTAQTLIRIGPLANLLHQSKQIVRSKVERKANRSSHLRFLTSSTNELMKPGLVAYLTREKYAGMRGRHAQSLQAVLGQTRTCCDMLSKLYFVLQSVITLFGRHYSAECYEVGQLLTQTALCKNQRQGVVKQTQGQLWADVSPLLSKAQPPQNLPSGSTGLPTSPGEELLKSRQIGQARPRRKRTPNTRQMGLLQYRQSLGRGSCSSLFQPRVQFFIQQQLFRQICVWSSTLNSKLLQQRMNMSRRNKDNVEVKNYLQQFSTEKFEPPGLFNKHLSNSKLERPPQSFEELSRLSNKAVCKSATNAAARQIAKAKLAAELDLIKQKLLDRFDNEGESEKRELFKQSFIGQGTSAVEQAITLYQSESRRDTSKQIKTQGVTKTREQQKRCRLSVGFYLKPKQSLFRSSDLRLERSPASAHERIDGAQFSFAKEHAIPTTVRECTAFSISDERENNNPNSSFDHRLGRLKPFHKSQVKL